MNTDAIETWLRQHCGLESSALGQLNESVRQTAESLRLSNETIRSLEEAGRGLRTGIERFKIRQG